jgi:dynactin 1
MGLRGCRVVLQGLALLNGNRNTTIQTPELHHNANRMVTMVDISQGQVVNLLDGRQAAVRFIGPTHFAAGDWIGVELDEPTGKNDGSVQGERYFDCEHGFGMFIRPSAVASVVGPAPKRESKQAPRATAAAGKPQSASTVGSAALKRTGSAATSAATRRQSTTASPSPAPRAPPTRVLRVWPRHFRFVFSTN